MNSLHFLKLTMAFISLFHLVAGVGFMFSVSFQKFAVSAYGATLPWNEQSIYFLRILGSFAFVLGTMALAAAKDPRRYWFVIVGFIEFFILRNIHRHLYSDELITGFGISNLTNDLTTLFFGAQAALLVYLLWKVRKIV